MLQGKKAYICSPLSAPNPEGMQHNMELAKYYLMDRIKRLRKLEEEGTMCSKCNLYRECQSKNCIMNSLAYSGSIGGHNPDMCYFEQKKKSLWEAYAKEL